MDLLPRLGAATTIALTTAADGLARRMSDVRDERPNDRGQASTEYAGILFVIVAIIAALIALTWSDVGNAIKDKIEQAVDKLGT
jgi:Flp pilus assembly pilin Flp